MAKKATKLRPWTKEDIRTLKTLTREKVKTTVIARKLKRSVQATYQKTSALGVTLESEVGSNAKCFNYKNNKTAAFPRRSVRYFA
jgi:SPX domain protein involved in polyphosphate accumulation